MSTKDELTLKKLTGVMSTLMQPSINDPYVSPRPASRVGASKVAGTYLERNRGTLSLFDDQATTDDDANPFSARGCCSARNPRILGRDAVEIFRRSFGTMDRFMDAEQNQRYSSPRPQPRLPTEDAEANAKRNAGVMGQYFDADRQNRGSVTARPPTCGSKAGKGLQPAGSMALILNTEANRNFAVPRPGSRARTAEAHDNAEKGKGTMSAVMGQPSSSQTEHQRADQGPRGAARMNVESSGVCIYGTSPFAQAPLSGDVPARRANKDLGTKGTLGAMMATYGQPPPAGERPKTAPGPHNHGQGAEIAVYGQKGTLCNLLNSYGELPQSARQDQRVRSDGKRYAYRGRGTMSLYISPHKPAHRTSKHTKKNVF